VKVVCVFEVVVVERKQAGRRAGFGNPSLARARVMSPDLPHSFPPRNVASPCCLVNGESQLTLDSTKSYVQTRQGGYYTMVKVLQTRIA